MGHAKAAAILLAIVVIAAAHIGLAIALGVTEFWAGFLFLVAWAILEKMQVSRLPAAILGSAGGAMLGYLATLLTPDFGAGAAFGVSLLLILLAIYAILAGWLSTLINTNFMLFLNVMSIPHILQQAQAVDVAKGLATGIVFFGGLALLMAWINKRKPAEA